MSTRAVGTPSVSASMPDTSDISILIVSYNVAPFIARCLDSLASASGHCDYEVVVVDNGSADASLDAIQNAAPRATVIDLGRNTGFAHGVNQAMLRARGRHLLLLNPDTVAEPGSIYALVRYLDEHSEVGVAAPLLLNPDGSDQGTARRFPTPAAGLLGRRSLLTRIFPNNRWSRQYLLGREQPHDRPFQCDWVSGACLAIRRSVVDEIGGLDEGFFMHWEDADWCRRVKEHGLLVTTVPDAVVYHDEGGSRKGWPARQVVHFHRSAYHYYTKHHMRGAKSVLRPVAALALTSRAAAIIAGGVFRRRT